MIRVPTSRHGGFSLVELMVVLVIATLLMSLAVPSYRQYVSRSHRTDAIARLLGVANCQERLRATQGAYDTSLCLPAARPRYAFEYGDEFGSGFTVLAKPLVSQASDPCGDLILGHNGSRDVGADRRRCRALLDRAIIGF